MPLISSDHATAGFRFSQEAIRNVSRHAQASHVGTTIQANGSTSKSSSRIKGVAFDSFKAMEQSAAGHGFGLLSMHDRIGFLHGTLTLTSQQGTGTQVQARLPVTTPANLNKQLSL